MRSLRTRLWAALVLLPAAFVLSACGGGDSSEETFSGQEVVTAFEEASDGYEFEKTISLVEGATAYAPKNESDPEVVEPLNDALGEASILWQVLVFEGSDPPVGEEAAKEAAFASDTFKEIEEGVYLGDHETAYAANGNVVVTGPVIDGDPADETLSGWREVIDGL